MLTPNTNVHFTPIVIPNITNSTWKKPWERVHKYLFLDIELAENADINM
jgi:hypothetical protein